MNGIYMLLGSNLGNRLEFLKEAERLLKENKIEILEESSIYETEPWGPKNQDWYLNVILEVNTSKDPETLLDNALEIEMELGRIRNEKWGERCIDIDLLYYHNEIMKNDKLTLPHPGIPERRFTLIPLVEMCPFEIHPILNKSHVELLAGCIDPLDYRVTEYKL